MPIKTLHNLKILIVEDDQFLRDLFVMKLKKEGAKIIEAENGEEAFSKVKSEMPDLVLLDVVLPKLDGFDVLKRIRNDETISKVPVIFLTNLGQQEEIDRGLRLGADFYIIKAHFTPSEVVAKIKEVMDLARKSNPPVGGVV